MTKRLNDAMPRTTIPAQRLQPDKSILSWVCLLALTFVPGLSFAQQSVTTVQKFAVGTCEPGLNSFTTISKAVAAVPSGATVLVCPGNYPEQVVIAQPLTLQGVQIGGSDAAVITSPGGGVVQNETSGYGQSVAAQIAVENTGPVNISNIAVDGTNNGGAACTFVVYGVYYQNSSGTINHIVARNQQTGSSCGFGIVLENDSSSASPTITVANNSVHGFDFDGILAATGPSASAPVANIQSNSVIGGANGVITFGSGTVSGNVVDNAAGVAIGVGIGTSGTVLKSNRVSNAGQFAIEVFDNTQVESNSIFNSGNGILVNGSNNLIKTNSITNSGAGAAGAIDLSCGASLNTVTGNVINEASTGIANSGNTTNTIAPNSYFDVQVVVGPCH
jgi:hypothetical protein